MSAAIPLPGTPSQTPQPRNHLRWLREGPLCSAARWEDGQPEPKATREGSLLVFVGFIGILIASSTLTLPVSAAYYVNSCGGALRAAAAGAGRSGKHFEMLDLAHLLFLRRTSVPRRRGGCCRSGWHCFQIFQSACRRGEGALFGAIVRILCTVFCVWLRFHQSTEESHRAKA